VPENMLKTISGNLKRLKNEKRIQSTEIAEALNVAKSTVSAWENGKKMPRAGHIQQLANFYGVSKSEILVPYDDQVKAIEITSEEERVYSKLTDENKKMLFEYAEFLLSKQTDETK